MVGGTTDLMVWDEFLAVDSRNLGSWACSTVFGMCSENSDDGSSEVTRRVDGGLETRVPGWFDATFQSFECCMDSRIGMLNKKETNFII